MKRLLALNILALQILSFIPAATARAQDEARAAWQIINFDIASNLLQPERALGAVAVLTIKNVGRGAGSGLTLRITSKAKINSVTADGAGATFRALPDVRANLQRLNLTLPAAVAPNSTINLSVNYRLPVE